MARWAHGGANGVVIVWGVFSPRGADLAAHLGAEMLWVHAPALPATRALLPLRYLVQSAMTMQRLATRRPTVIFVQNPPVFAPLSALAYNRVCRSGRIVVDSHSGAFNSSEWRWSLPLQRWVSRYSVTVVHNEEIMRVVRHWPGKAVVLDDPPMALCRGNAAHAAQQPLRVQVVCSGAWDEPIDAVVQAALLLPRVRFHITGDHRRRTPRPEAPQCSNVTFTGYLARAEYTRQLCTANAVMALTTRGATMLRGAWEGMYSGRPLILSDTTTLRRYFTAGAIFVPNTVEGIVGGVREALDKEDTLSQEIRALAVAKRKEWLAQMSELQRLLRPECRPGQG